MVSRSSKNVRLSPCKKAGVVLPRHPRFGTRGVFRREKNRLFFSATSLFVARARNHVIKFLPGKNDTRKIPRFLWNRLVYVTRKRIRGLFRQPVCPVGKHISLSPEGKMCFSIIHSRHTESSVINQSRTETHTKVLQCSHRQSTSSSGASQSINWATFANLVFFRIVFWGPENRFYLSETASTQVSTRRKKK